MLIIITKVPRRRPSFVISSRYLGMYLFYGCQICSVARSRESTRSELVVNLSTLCVPKTKRKATFTSAAFFLDEFHTGWYVVSFHIFYGFYIRYEATFRVSASDSERSSTRILNPKFVSGHERARHKAAIHRFLTNCRDHVSVVPAPTWNNGIDWLFLFIWCYEGMILFTKVIDIISSSIINPISEYYQ